MPLQQTGEIQYYQFSSLAQTAVTHAVFARQGGVSTAPFASLNMSVSVGDARENVRANRERAFRALGRDPASVVDLWQIHSADVVVATSPTPEGTASPQADALITNRRDLTLFLRFADCVPMVLYDPAHHAIGLVHAGWRGTLKKAAAAAVSAMREQFGTRPAEVLAGIGPSIGPCHYAVGEEVVTQTRAAFGAEVDALLRAHERPNGQYHLDLWEANALALRQTGVEQIEVSGLCTACHTQHFFSHRGEQGKTGRFGALIALA